MIDKTAFVIDGRRRSAFSRWARLGTLHVFGHWLAAFTRYYYRVRLHAVGASGWTTWRCEDEEIAPAAAQLSIVLRRCWKREAVAGGWKLEAGFRSREQRCAVKLKTRQLRRESFMRSRAYQLTVALVASCSWAVSSAAQLDYEVTISVAGGPERGVRHQHRGPSLATRYGRDSSCVFYTADR